MTTAVLTPCRVGIQHVLIATDFSHQSKAALSYGLRFAHEFAAPADILYVMPVSELALAGPDVWTTARDAVRRDVMELKSYIQRALGYQEGTDFHLLEAEGGVAECILDCARERKSDLLVLGTHGRTGWGRTMLGSVAEHVFRRSAAPVMTVGPHVAPDAKTTPHRILLPLDFTPASGAAAWFACALAGEHHAEVIALHVIPPAAKGMAADIEGVKRQLREMLERRLAQFAASIQPQYCVDIGDVAPTITRLAYEKSADLIAVGVKPPKAFERFFWPVAYDVVSQAHCPVITVRHADAES